ncbi:hypothetical protein M011DRAFT_471080 [Sporormia fimetaria CBS 119925]|uniref:Uncharacterized protein n=1 Tax=Sporormia fimetaria CBS 119925 TaxID=1340428 RepID=A0A6A6V1N4_9PLEO|nr:hypothetical protein M011DRAFT_471080 [Sporormia fimetaria CBS 119925]
MDASPGLFEGFHLEAVDSDMPLSPYAMDPIDRMSSPPFDAVALPPNRLDTPVNQNHVQGVGNRQQQTEQGMETLPYPTWGFGNLPSTLDIETTADSTARTATARHSLRHRFDWNNPYRSPGPAAYDGVADSAPETRLPQGPDWQLPALPAHDRAANGTEGTPASMPHDHDGQTTAPASIRLPPLSPLERDLVDIALRRMRRTARTNEEADRNIIRGRRLSYATIYSPSTLLKPVHRTLNASSVSGQEMRRQSALLASKAARMHLDVIAGRRC